MSIDRIGRIPEMNKVDADGTERVPLIEGINIAEDLYVSGVAAPYCHAWWEVHPTKPTILIAEVIHADGSIDRWENGLPVPPPVDVA